MLARFVHRTLKEAVKDCNNKDEFICILLNRIRLYFGDTSNKFSLEVVQLIVNIFLYEDVSTMDHVVLLYRYIRDKVPKHGTLFKILPCIHSKNKTGYF